MTTTWRAMRAARLAREAAESEAEARAQEEAAAAAAQAQAELEARLKGEKGDKGDKGDSIKGDKGDSIKGDPGRDGIGLKGDKGDKGDSIKGDPGRDGIGLKGDPGKRGPQGLPGAYAVRAEFRRGDGQRIESVVESLSDGSERTFTVQRDAAGRPVGLI